MATLIQPFSRRVINTLLSPLIWLGWHSASHFTRWRHRSFLQAVNQEFAQLVPLSMTALQAQTIQIRSQMQAQNMQPALINKAFALVKVMCQHSMGMMPYDTQLIAARVMLEGQLAEMATGEGKTLTAALGAAVAAFSGKPLHLLTTNDYLVQRDATHLKPFYESLGLTVSAVTANLNASQRKQAYRCDVVYSTAKELIFDYLRDEANTQHIASNLHLHAAKISGDAPETVLRGLSIIFLDEADSLLIDEATVPLILSKYVVNAEQQAYFSQAIQIARQLTQELDFKLHKAHMAVELTPVGADKVLSLAHALGGIWHNALYANELIQTALSALHLYHNNQQYLIDEHDIKVIDTLTGRVAEGRVWSKGLHQMIALKEGLAPTGEVETISQITYQRFFAQIALLGGMSGTLHEARLELFDIYNLTIQTIPLHRPSQRKLLPLRVFKCADDSWQFALHRIQELHRMGRPILIGTDSVADSEKISAMLKLHQLPHKVLNARQNAIEASIIAEAGQLGRITVSTNMAGRGTDIHISKQVADLGGLHVISCQHNDSNRIDRQLIGRAARQGDPGSAELLINLRHYGMYAGWMRYLDLWLTAQGRCHPMWLVKFIAGLPKWLTSYHQRQIRRSIFQQDVEIEKGNFSV